MQSTRAITSKVKPHRIINATKHFKPITTTTTTLSPHNNIHTTSKMAMFGPRFYTAEPNFTGLFRLIDDFDKYALQNNTTGSGQGPRHARHHLPTFTPKFDMRETEHNYELHGELPGIEKENVHVEFTDAQTIVVRGRVERSYEAGTPPAGLLEKAPETPAAIAEAPKEGEPDHHDKAHQPTVEDDTTEGEPTPATTTVSVAETEKVEQQQQPKQPGHKFWVSERSVGEFSRTFQFPGRVDTDGVAASLDNGILTVVVPKAKKHEGRRILIN
ncbi:HSP20-like chaperone [Annulohypoxylon maeteangense]|uniref:HSP20-like chaperone n=1 Tax=Annulohypoxylon maeteangense TaxID=1927788 RepID=UPI0020073962|nr:HSP20-like chaperone [Annulohypoxylon maeteangense]KAI0889798.1 HSP20-like chaperone [Annulohypoxylon maeteangense]